ncbi:MAG TPA: hypothetical protein VNU66_11950 [Mycobacteriales bacterium]|nr:hypothetical protein [Mycobacteriales bacterium]
MLRPSALDDALLDRAGPLAGGLLLLGAALVAVLGAVLLEGGPVLRSVLVLGAAWGAVVGGATCWSARR